MNLNVTAKCHSVEKGEGADVVEFHSLKSDPDDAKGPGGQSSYQVDAILKLTLDNPATRGKFEVGKNYVLDIAIEELAEPAAASV